MAAASRLGLASVYGGSSDSDRSRQSPRRRCVSKTSSSRRHRLTTSTPGSSWPSSKTAASDVPHECRAEATLSTGQLDELDVSESDLVYFSGYALLHESNARALLKFLTQIPGATNFLFDPGPIVNEISESMLDAVFERVDWFSCNQREAFLLTDASNSSESARLLRARMNRGGAIVRVGAEGCVVAQSERHSIAVAGFAVESVDTNGAGTVIWERSRPRWPRVARLWCGSLGQRGRGDVSYETRSGHRSDEARTRRVLGSEEDRAELVDLARHLALAADHR